MNLSLFEAASGMTANSRWEEVIAENLAASQVPGYKRQDLSFEAFSGGLVPVQSTAGPNYMMPRSTISADFSQGVMRPTNVDTDMAIDGNGFFAVQLPSGDVAYTRDGEFHRGAGGQLVSKQGYPVLGDNGPIQLDPNNPMLTVTASGQIFQGTQAHGKLRVVSFDNPKGLTSVGAGNFTANGPGMKPADVAEPTVRQGHLEMSNANPAGEMARLVSSLRMYEMNQRVIQSQDERMGKTITELAGPN